jgi:hypothetical protein
MGSNSFGIRCDTLERLDYDAFPFCDLFASLRWISTVYDVAHPVSGTIVKEFESFLIPSHPPPFDFFLPGPPRDLRDGDPILGEPDVVIGDVWLGLARF